MKKIGVFLISGLAMTMAAPAMAEFDDRWYLSPMFLYTDQNRQAHNGQGATVGLGKPISDRFNIEFSIFGQNFGARSGLNRAAYDEYGLKFNTHWFPYRGVVEPYLTGGIGIVRNERKDPPRRKDTDPMAEVGGGLIVPINDWGVGLRVEGLYRYVDYEHPPRVPGGPDIDGVEEKLANVGLYVPLSPPPGSVASAPEAAPVSQPDYPDADGDGVPDHADACANTPAGARVDGAGCRLRAPSSMPKDPDLEPDTDGDLLIDRLDPCPNHPSDDPFVDRSCL